MDQDNTKQDQGTGQSQPVDPAPVAPATPEQPVAAPAQPVLEPVAEPAPAVETPVEATPAPAVEPTPEVPAEPAPQPEAVAEPTPEPVATPTPAPEVETPVEEAPAPAVEPTPAPADAAPETPQAPASEGCCCPTVQLADYDKKQSTFNKTFYKTWSPRLIYYPFSMPIDINRAKTGAEKAGLTIPASPMLMDTGGMFWSNLYLEVEPKEGAAGVMTLSGEYYTKASTRPWKEMCKDMKELEEELGHKPTELFVWYTACPKCVATKEVKTVFIAK